MPKTSRKISPDTSALNGFSKEEKAILRNEEIKISVEDMQTLLREWDLNGHTDLTVDLEMKRRIDNYLEFQSDLDQKREALAQRYCKSYEIPFVNEKRKVHLFLNKKNITEIFVYTTEDGFKKVVLFSDFRIILMAIHNEIAKWIPIISGKGVDIVAWAVDNGGSCKYEYAMAGFDRLWIDIPVPSL